MSSHSIDLRTGSACAVVAFALAQLGYSQEVAPFTNLDGGLAGAEGVPNFSPKGVPFPGYSVDHQISGAAASQPGALVLGLSRADLPLFGGTLIPAPDWSVTLVADSNGGASPSTPWDAIPPGTELYAQSLFIDNQAPGGFSFSNGVLMRTFADASQANAWQAMVDSVDAEYGVLLNTRDLSDAEADMLKHDPRVTMMEAVVRKKYPLFADITTAQVSTYQNAVKTDDLVVVPLLTNTGSIAGGIYLYDLGNPNAIYTAAIGGLPGQYSFSFMGPNGDEIVMKFTEQHKFLGASILTDSDRTDPDWWELFKKWLSSDSGAEGLPWWLDILCGIVCGDALLGTHNPWSWSLCIHCAGAYILACVPAPAP